MAILEVNNDVENWKNKFEEGILLYNRLQEANRKLPSEMVKAIQSFIANLDCESV